MLQKTEYFRSNQHDSEKINTCELNSQKNTHKIITREFIRKYDIPFNTNFTSIRQYFDKLTIEVNTVIDCEGINIEFMVRKSIQIDWVILQLALKSSSAQKENDVLKEAAWALLEKLEAYCSTKLGISIW